MRVLRYELKLSEFGYMIASGNIVADDNIVKEKTTLPIKVTLSDGHKHLLKRIIPELAYDEKKVPEFGKHYQEILLNENPDWYLYSCEITARSLVLGYYNRKIDENGSMVFEAANQSIKFQLAVPHQNSKPDSIYDVYLLAESKDLEDPRIKRYEARVTEYYDNGYRKLTFLDESNRAYSADKYVCVDEYVDL